MLKSIAAAVREFRSMRQGGEVSPRGSWRVHNWIGHPAIQAGKDAAALLRPHAPKLAQLAQDLGEYAHWVTEPAGSKNVEHAFKVHLDTDVPESLKDRLRVEVKAYAEARLAAMSHGCQTPEGQFHINISADQVGVALDLPFELELDEAQAEQLEDELHDVMELVMRRYWR